MDWIDQFKDQKEMAVERWEVHLEEGKADEDAVPLVRAINSKKNYYTTSSCAGRIVIMKIPDPGRKEDAEFLKKWHREIKLKELLDGLKEHKNIKNKWIIFNPPIFHIGSRTLEDAYKITQLGIQSGFKNSGIRSVTNKKIITQIISTEGLDVPYSDSLTDDYLRDLKDNLNFMLRRSRNKMSDFKSKIEDLN